jgi:hypothetical protein
MRYVGRFRSGEVLLVLFERAKSPRQAEENTQLGAPRESNEISQKNQDTCGPTAHGQAVGKGYTCLASGPRYVESLSKTADLSSMNAPVLVPVEGETDPLEIALKELAAKKIPLVIRRYLPGRLISLHPPDPYSLLR